MEARLLGSGGWVPSDGRETSCVYLRDGAHAIVLDAGTGLRRLVTDPSLLAGVERLDLFLTHFHLDHTAGLVYLPGFARVPRRELWAPGQIVAGVAGEELVHRLLDPPFLAGDPADVTGEFLTAVNELDGDVKVGAFSLQLRVQPRHVGPTVALRVNGGLVYCTDTAYDEGNAEFARDAGILLHEAVHAADETDDPMHSAAGEAGRIAAAAHVERLVLVHVQPLADEHRLLACARARFAATELGRDGMTLSPG